MRALYHVLVAGACILLSAAPVWCQEEESAPKDRYIIQLRQQSQGGPRPEALDSLVGPSGRIWYRYPEPFYGIAVTLADTARERLQNDSVVVEIEPDEYIHNPQPALAARAAGIDPAWSLAQIGATSLSSDGGSGVTVYILDSGIRTSHKEFGGRATLGPNFMRGPNTGGDCNGHGTHVAGVIGGQQRGIARGAQLVGVRVLHCDGFGTTSSVLAGLGWVRANAKRPAVVNLSLTLLHDGQSELLDRAVAELVELGIPVVVAAGNQGDEACEHAPGSSPNAITVAATDQRDRRIGFSNFGQCVKIFAPGAHIYSASNRADDRYRVLHGTSQAAGLVSGTIALLLQRYPDLPVSEIVSRLYAATRPGVSNLEGSPDRRMMVP